MRTIQPYQGDALVLYDEIVASKRDGAERHRILERLRSRIASRYALYERSRRELENFAPDGKLTKEEREALFHCYDVETIPLARMKRDVLAALPREANQCPYCGIGEIGHGDGGESGDWDHYLPRRSRPDPRQGFADLSVHPTNLVPCCATCNRHKGDRWREGSQRQFINVYYDDIDQSVPLLEASIHVQPGSEPRVMYRFARRPYEPFFSLYKRHCDGLDLLRRYAWAAGPKVAAIRRDIRRLAVGRSEAQVAECLREEAEELAGRVGINHWEPTLYRAAAASGEFLRHCLEDGGAVRGDGVDPSGGRQT